MAIAVSLAQQTIPSGPDAPLGAAFAGVFRGEPILYRGTNYVGASIVLVMAAGLTGGMAGAACGIIGNVGGVPARGAALGLMAFLGIAPRIRRLRAGDPTTAARRRDTESVARRRPAPVGVAYRLDPWPRRGDPSRFPELVLPLADQHRNPVRDRRRRHLGVLWHRENAGVGRPWRVEI
jgi:hypothetical protein